MMRNDLLHLQVWLILVFALQSPAAAETFSNEVLSLEVPVGFEGPVSDSPGPGAEMTAFTKPYTDRSGGTLFQITTYDFQSSLEGMPEEERGNASEYYLGQFLDGVEKKRTNFSASKPERLSLGGIPGSRVDWSGMFNGTPASGVMYCVIIGTTVVSLHTQDIDGAPPENRAVSVRAFERLRARGR